MGDFRVDPSYRSLRDAVAEGTTQVVAFVGAGLSAPAGLPTWAKLKRLLVEALRGKANTFSPADAKKLGERADVIASEGDFWVAFSRLRTELGQTTFESEIRAALAAADHSDPPPAYEAVWRLPRLEGVLTLNLDRFALRAFSGVFPTADVKHFIGTDAARLQRILHSGDRFTFNLHGVVDDAASWVLTKEDVNRLLKGPAYRQLVTTILTTYTVVFLGVGVDDIAIGGPLHELKKLGIQSRPHYWITDRRDMSTDTWAEANGVRVIRYATDDGDHAVLREILNDLSGYVPTDIANPRPVTLVPDGAAPVGALPPPDELVRQDIAHIRDVLNRRATELLPADADDEGEDDYSAFETFVDEYDEAVHRAWYTSHKTARNSLFGYTLLDEVARGAFGRVYQATDAAGNPVAVKVLLEEIRTDIELVKSFRRGVRAMRILKRYGFSGMVAFREASEIPAFVSMDWIDGPNLAEAKAARQLEDWNVVLRIALDTVRIIRKAHELPERVLHRDIRPSNIMLRDFYSQPDSWQVVVLDFDLAWHRGASGKSVLHTTAYGYLAPEQVFPRPGQPTRSAAVDVFGLGMTLLYLCGGREPAADEHNHRNYEQIVKDAVANVQESSWLSLPARMARLIMAMTRDAQRDRLDMRQVERELELLQAADAEPKGVESAELLCEEVAAAADVFRGYVWSADDRAAKVKKPTGLEATLTADEARGEITLSVTWDATGMEMRTSLPRNLNDAGTTAESRLRGAGWSISSRTRGRSLALTASIPAQSVVGRPHDIATKIDNALELLRRTE